MAGNYRYISEQEKKLVITMSLRGMKVKDIELATGIACRTIKRWRSLWKSTGKVVRVDGCLYWDDKVIAFRGRTPRARSAESCCGADIVQAYAAPYPKWMISKVLGAHRKNRKVSRVLQIAVNGTVSYSKVESLRYTLPSMINVTIS